MFWVSFSQILSHLADALSFANNSNVPGDIALEVASLCSRWVQSASIDYDFLFGPVLNPWWAREHKPVVSTQNGKHALYTRAATDEPDGKLVVCHNACGTILDIHSGKKKTRFTCTDCESTTFVPLSLPRRGGALGYHGLVRTPFPQERYPAMWAHCEPTKPPKFQLPPTPILPATAPPNPKPPSPLPSTLTLPAPLPAKQQQRSRVKATEQTLPITRSRSAPTRTSTPTPDLAPGPQPTLKVRIPLRRPPDSPSPTSPTETPLSQEHPLKKRKKTVEDGAGLGKQISKKVGKYHT